MKRKEFKQMMHKLMKEDPEMTISQAYIKVKLKAKLLDHIKGV
jgi:hypothetical protein